MSKERGFLVNQYFDWMPVDWRNIFRTIEAQVEEVLAAQEVGVLPVSRETLWVNLTTAYGTVLLSFVLSVCTQNLLPWNGARMWISFPTLTGPTMIYRLRGISWSYLPYFFATWHHPGVECTAISKSMYSVCHDLIHILVPNNYIHPCSRNVLYIKVYIFLNAVNSSTSSLINLTLDFSPLRYPRLTHIRMITPSEQTILFIGTYPIHFSPPQATVCILNAWELGHVIYFSPRRELEERFVWTFSSSLFYSLCGYG